MILIKALLIAWFITHFQPFQTYIVGTLEGINKGLFEKKLTLYLLFASMMKPLTCLKCACFWITLLMGGGIWFAITASIIGYHYDKLDSNIKIRL